MQPENTEQQNSSGVDLHRDIEEFLKSGKSITVVEAGVSGESEESWSWNDSQYPFKKSKEDDH